MKWEKADNDRLGGKMWMHEMLRWKNKPPSYIPEEGFQVDLFHQILRNSGPNAATDYYDMFQPEPPETGLPKLQVTKSCVEFRKVIPSCVYDDKDGEVVEDVKEFNGDDPYDGGRYLVKAFQRLLREAVAKGQSHDRLAEIITTLKERATGIATTVRCTITKGRRRVRCLFGEDAVGEFTLTPIEFGMSGIAGRIVLFMPLKDQRALARELSISRKRQDCSLKE
jgi:hypothetical protein